MGLCKCAFSPLTPQKSYHSTVAFLFKNKVWRAQLTDISKLGFFQKQSAIAKCDNIFNNVLNNKDSRTRTESDELDVTVLQETD